MKRRKSWALCLALQMSACGLAGCNSAPPLPSVGSQASARGEQTLEQMMAAARFMENQGVQQSDPEKLELARQGYMTILARVPDSQFAHHRLAVLAARGGHFDTAELHFQKAMTAGAPSSELLADSGYNLYLQNRLDEAATSLRAAIEKDPRNQTAMNNLGMVLGEMGDTEAAFGQFERVVGTAEAHANLAKVYTHLGRLEEAKDEYNLALSLDRSLRPAAEALVQLEDATTSRARAMNQIPREELAGRAPMNRGRADVRGRERQRDEYASLPTYEEKYGANPEVRPVSQQAPVPVDEYAPRAQQPAPRDDRQQRMEQFFETAQVDVPARQPAADMQQLALQPQAPVAQAPVTQQQPVVQQQPIVQQQPQPAAAASMSEMASTLGQQPVTSAAERVASASQPLEQAVTQTGPATFAEPPLPGFAPQLETVKPQPRPQVVAQPAPQQIAQNPAPTAAEQASANVPPSQAPQQMAQPTQSAPAPQRVNNPFANMTPQPRGLAPMLEASIPALATPPQSTATLPKMASAMASSSIASSDMPATNKATAQVATTPAATTPVPTYPLAGSPQPVAVAQQRVQPHDLPVGEPTLGPIMAAPAMAQVAPVPQQSGAAGLKPTNFDFRLRPAGDQKSLQKLIDDEDY